MVLIEWLRAYGVLPETVDDVRCSIMRWLGSLLVFILVLAVMKYFFGWPISIGGSLVLSLILTGVFSLFGRR
jgi:hypothetical protein